MHLRPSLIRSSALATLLVASGFSVAQNTTKVDDNALRSSGKTGSEWLSVGLDYAETRYSRLTQIDTSNVGQLGLAWWIDMPGGQHGHSATPLFADGVLYSVSTSGITFAIDARSGKEKWRHDPHRS
jgi:quinohemoprotein ethanol dehydrogenase